MSMSPSRSNGYSVACSAWCQKVWLGCSWKYHGSGEVKGAEWNEFHWFVKFGNANSVPSMIFTGRSVDALDEVRGSNVQTDNRRDVSAVAIAAGWFSSLRRPGKRNKKGYQKQAKSTWDLSTLSMVSWTFCLAALISLERFTCPTWNSFTRALLDLAGAYFPKLFYFIKHTIYLIYLHLYFLLFTFTCE